MIGGGMTVGEYLNASLGQTGYKIIKHLSTLEDAIKGKELYIEDLNKKIQATETGLNKEGKLQKFPRYPDWKKAEFKDKIKMYEQYKQQDKFILGRLKEEANKRGITDNILKEEGRKSRNEKQISQFRDKILKKYGIDLFSKN